MSAQAIRIMTSGNVLVSPVSVWEITRKIALGKLARPTTSRFGGSYAAYLRSAGYGIAPLGWQEAEYANQLPDHHKDPMDRLLIATAILRNLAIVTNDGVFGKYPVTTLW